MFDVLVIGSGLAGTIAALAARGRGAHVAMASRSWGATAMSTGAVDLAYTPALSRAYQTPRTIAEHVMDIIAHRKRHPYGILGLERTFESLAAGYDLLSKALSKTDLALEPLELEADNVGLPSSLGTVIPGATAFGPHRGVDLAQPVSGRWGVLQLYGDAGFDADRLRRGWAHDAAQLSGKDVELVEIGVSYRAREAMATASALDDQGNADQLARDLSSHAGDLDGLIAPPVLGLRRSAEVRRRISDAIEAPVVEALAHLPSVPGVRLQRQLERELQEAGVAAVGEVVEARTDAGGVRALLTRDNLDLRAGAVVLASGRFTTGGITWTDRCKEALFGLPVVTELGEMEDDSPLPVVRELPTESHPLMTAGVWVDASLQPLAEGRVAHANLFAAGNVLGGFASRYTLCSDGVALCTGWLAGCAAAALGGRQ